MGRSLRELRQQFPGGGSVGGRPGVPPRSSAQQQSLRPPTRSFSQAPPRPPAPAVPRAASARDGRADEKALGDTEAGQHYVTQNFWEHHVKPVERASEGKPVTVSPHEAEARLGTRRGKINVNGLMAFTPKASQRLKERIQAENTAMAKDATHDVVVDFRDLSPPSRPFIREASRSERGRPALRSGPLEEITVRGGRERAQSPGGTRRFVANHLQEIKVRDPSPVRTGTGEGRGTKRDRD